MELLDTTKRKKLYFDIVLDKQQYYFNNDRIRGKVVLITPKSLYVKRVQLCWKGTVKIQLGSLKQDQHVLFQHSEYLDIDQQNSSFYLKPGDYYEFLFDLQVPNQMAIPSFTESEFYIGGNIEYSIEAFLERPTTSLFPRARTCRWIPLLDRVSITQPAFVTKKSIRTRHEDIILELGLPKTAFKRHQTVEVTVELLHCKEEMDVQVSLIRTTQVICKERLFLLPEVIVESANVTLSENRASCHLMIPPTASPSIHDTGHLLHISYMIRAQLVQIPLIAECPIVIGTYPLDPDEKPQDIHPSTLLKGVLYEEIPNATFMDRQIASHHFHETATKIHHHSIHTGSSFHQRVNSVYDDDEDDEGFTSLYSMSSREYK